MNNTIFKKFIDDIIKDDSYIIRTLSEDRYKHKSFTYTYNSEIKDYKNLYLVVDWSLGGIHGNCYDDSKYVVDPEDEPEFTSLYTILERLQPDISFLKYQTKIVPLIHTYDESNGDYYGGYTTTRYKYINLWELCQAIS